MNRSLGALFSALLLASLMLLGLAPARAQTLPFEAFAQDPAITDASISPNGRWLATVQRASVDGEPFAAIYDVENLAKGRLRTLGAKNMSVNSATWVNDDYLLVVFTQQFDEGARTRRIAKVASIRRDGGGFVELPKRRMDRRTSGASAEALSQYAAASVISLLPGDDEHVMISYVVNAVTGVRAIAKVNVASGAIVSETEGNTRYRGFGVDPTGEVRTAVYSDRGTGQLVYVARAKGSEEWLEIGRSGKASEDSAVSAGFAVLGFPNKDDYNEILVLSNHESDTTGIYSFDIPSRSYKELLFRHPKYDAAGYVDIEDPQDPERNYLTGFRFDGRGGEIHWIDPGEKAFHENLNGILPNANNYTIDSSRDRSVRLILSNGPRTPDTFFLYSEKAGGLQRIGQSMPQLPADGLSNVEFTSYTARDGAMIPALITKPSGTGPFPLVVMPHGGPTARDTWGFDLWAQLFAHHGYLVVQPQYRISTGFGRAHLESGFREWGLKQQDDIDDSIRFLVERGLADPQRVAIMGWSYGGYSAAVGAARDPNPYKCAIAGAGVLDMDDFRAYLYSVGNSSDPIFRYRDTVQGLDPIAMVDSVDVPILVIHGTEDERVAISHSDKYVAALRGAGKQHEYLKLEGANHFFGTIYYRHWMEMFPKMIDWLDNTCDLK